MQDFWRFGIRKMVLYHIVMLLCCFLYYLTTSPVCFMCRPSVDILVPIDHWLLSLFYTSVFHFLFFSFELFFCLFLDHPFKFFQSGKSFFIFVVVFFWCIILLNSNIMVFLSRLTNTFCVILLRCLSTLIGWLIIMFCIIFYVVLVGYFVLYPTELFFVN